MRDGYLQWQERRWSFDIVHADHGVQFTSWAFTGKVRSAGLMLSFGSIGDALDDAMMESLRSSMQDELLEHKRWTPRIELSNAMLDCIEAFYNRRRRHSKLGYVSPIEYECTLNQEAARLNRIGGNQACSRSRRHALMQQTLHPGWSAVRECRE